MPKKPMFTTYDIVLKVAPDVIQYCWQIVENHKQLFENPDYLQVFKFEASNDMLIIKVFQEEYPTTIYFYDYREKFKNFINETIYFFEYPDSYQVLFSYEY